MSAGRFEFVGVELPDDEVARIRVQPETEGLEIGDATNAGVANPSGQAERILVSVGRRRRGVRIAGKVRFSFSGTPPTGYASNAVISLPILNREMLEAAQEGATGTYLGSAIVVAGSSPPIGFTYR